MQATGNGMQNRSQRGGDSRSRALLFVFAGTAFLCCLGLAAGLFIITRTTLVQRPHATSTAGMVLASPSADLNPKPTETGSPGPALPGGLTDDHLKSQVQDTIRSFYRNVRGCNEVTISEIDVTQEPDSSGVWEEAWTVSACGNVWILSITFTPGAEGRIYYDITE